VTVSTAAIRAFVIDDIRVFREVLATLLRTHEGIEVVGFGPVCPAVLAHLAESSPDVTLVNVSLGASIRAVKAIRSAAPNSKVIGVGLPETEQDVVGHAEAGIAGYVSTDASPEDLIATVENVSRGEMPVSPRISSSLIHRVAVLAEGHASGTLACLTPRETEIARLVAQGLANKQIAQRLSIELRTVKNHVHHIFEKLGVSNRGAVIRIVFESALTSPD
jgi:DNA-binding NarL/FixJ family response regulator